MLAHCSVTGYSTVGKQVGKRSAAASSQLSTPPPPAFRRWTHRPTALRLPRLSKTGKSDKATESQHAGETDGDEGERAEEAEKDAEGQEMRRDRYKTHTEKKRTLRGGSEEIGRNRLRDGNSLVVQLANTPHSQCRGPRFDPCSGSQIPHAATMKATCSRARAPPGSATTIRSLSITAAG